MRTWLIGVSALLWGFCIASCAHGPQAESGSAGKNLRDYMPLAVGNVWTYATQFRGQEQPDLSVSIVREEGGFFVDDRPQPSRMAFDSAGLRDGGVRYLLKTPLIKGTKWMSVADVKTVERYEIVDDDRTVRSPAGIYKECVTVRMEVRITPDKTMRNEMTFAPAVGIVEVKTSLLVGKKLMPQSGMLLKRFESKTKNK